MQTRDENLKRSDTFGCSEPIRLDATDLVPLDLPKRSIEFGK